MLFSGIPFLYYFLPCVLIVYFLAPKALRNTVLVLASLFFYAWGEQLYVWLMIASIVISYISGLLIDRYQSRRTVAKTVLILTAAIDLGLLGYFKYADFFIENFNALTGMSVPLLQVVLPIGISFYTFQMMSYTIDVYRRTVPVQKNLIHLAAYVTMFPQLIAGPIVRYSDVNLQLETRSHSFEKTWIGIRRFVFGLAKKILIANPLGELCDLFRTSDDLSVLFYWIYAVAFALHIYFDFSGYSDMAIGLGHMFGFDFPENFRYPYISKSITEFWRRWHMTLGSWFRDYVYIPLGGNRVSKPRWFFNIFVVWMLTGFWHGAAWNFILWGLLFAVLLIAEKLWLLRPLEKLPLLAHLYVLFFVILSFVLFNAQGLSGAWNDLSSLFGAGDIPLTSAEAFYYLRSYAVLLIIGILGSTPLPQKAVAALKTHRRAQTVLAIAEPIVLVLLFLMMTAYLVDGSFNPFLYFRF